MPTKKEIEERLKMQVELENINLIKDIKEDLELIKKTLTNKEQKRWLSVSELSKYLSYSKDHIYKLKDEIFIENIHFYKKVGKILFDRVAIDEWVVGKDYDEIIQSQRQIVGDILS